MRAVSTDTVEMAVDFLELAKRRRSIRAFSKGHPEQEKIWKILEAANAAPSAGNLQAYEIYVVTGERERRALARAAHEQLFIASAPVVLVFCACPARSVERYGRMAVRLYALQDATIACTFAMLAAAAMRLASVWVGAFDDHEVRHILGAPRGIVPVAILPIGYPAEKPKPPGRRSLDDLVHWVGDSKPGLA